MYFPQNKIQTTICHALLLTQYWNGRFEGNVPYMVAFGDNICSAFIHSMPTSFFEIKGTNIRIWLKNIFGLT